MKKSSITFLIILILILLIIVIVILKHTFVIKRDILFNQKSLQPKLSTISYVTDLQSGDINLDGRIDLVVASAMVPKIWLKGEQAHSEQSAPDLSYTGSDEIIVFLNNINGVFQPSSVPIPNDMGNPGIITLQDLDKDKDLDIIVSILGKLRTEATESVKNYGGLIVIENVLKEDHFPTFKSHVIEDNILRTVKGYAKDLDRDGDLDIAVASFGEEIKKENKVIPIGDTHWLENLGNWKFKRHKLSNDAGALAIVDLSFLVKDAYPILGFLLSQTEEKIEAVHFQDLSNIRKDQIYKMDNTDWGSVRLETADMNNDGNLDLVWTNGDSEDISAKPWHGISWLKQINGEFELGEIGKLAGAYNGIPVDLDLDKDMEIVTSRFGGEFGKEDPATIGIYANLGGGNFSDYKPIFRNNTGVVPLSIGDLDNDNDQDIIFFDLESLKILILENQSRSP